MTGSVSQATSGAALAESRPAPGRAVSDIVLAVTERQIAAGETACFPFSARTAYGIPSIHEFSVTSDNPGFDPEWVRLRRSAGDSYGPPYILEIGPGAIGRSQYGAYPPQYGAYPLRLSWRAAGAYGQAAGQCVLLIKPRVRAVAEPIVETRPGGQIWLLLENRDSTGIDRQLHHGFGPAADDTAEPVRGVRRRGFRGRSPDHLRFRPAPLFPARQQEKLPRFRYQA